MPRAKHVKRRRREELLSHSSGVLYYASDVEDEDDDDDDDDDEEEEAVHVCKAKGKERVRDSDVRDVVDAGGYDVAGVSPAQEKVAGDRQQQQQQICGICLTEEAVERGILDCCDHPFCFGCIMEWAKVESRCPMCKQRFVTIFRPSLPGVPRSRPRTFRIPHRDQVYEPSEEEILNLTDPYLQTVCYECQEAGDEGLLLLCDGCDAAAHTYCVGLGRMVPHGDWFCVECTGLNDPGMSSDEENEVEHLDASFGPLHTFLVTGVHPVRRRRQLQRGHRLRSSATPAPLFSHGGLQRTRRLPPAPSPSQEAQALMLSSAEANRSSGMEATPAGGARTLFQQRRLRQRINHMRSNWHRIRSGDVQFPSSRLASPPRAHITQSTHTETDRGTLQRFSGVTDSAPASEIAQAWTMMEQARALRGDRVTVTADPELGNRATKPRESTHGQASRPVTRAEGYLSAQRENQARDTNRRGESLGENAAEVVSHHHGSTPRQNKNGQNGYYLREGSRQQVNTCTDAQMMSSNAKESRVSRDTNERQNGIHASAGLQVSMRMTANEQQRSVVEQRSREEVREGDGHVHQNASSLARDRKDMKEEVLNMVKVELKPLYQLNHIDKRQYKKIACSATQMLLGTTGLEQQGRSGRALWGLTCAHVSSSSSSSNSLLLPGCCNRCIRRHVNKVVGSMVKKP
ncbi:hypothetical protein BDL97_12G032700 [Sphagnum fallax]|nr:hypothetical protein BDL97_12G032700 [Sphagnum fallax]KAH8945266.1 hypothetical protein BDL97_12G032700 [Sphagnum fallax]